jgi:uncharacterized protein YgiM (DUF1202 family)
MRIRNIIIGGAILSVILGFTLGRTVVANSPAPGSEADPVVSKSYVDKALQERVDELEAEVAELTVRSQALQDTINELQAKINKTPVKNNPTTPGSSKPDNDNKPATPGSETSPIGRTASVIKGTARINLRSGAGTNYAELGKVNAGETMTILQVAKDKDGKDWYQVTLSDNTTGWVAGWLVKVK